MCVTNLMETHLVVVKLHGSARKVKGSSKSLGFTLWGP